jgi:hypothetical protein
VLGWARYHPPHWWTWIALALSLLGAAGIVRLLRDRATTLRPVVLAGLAVIVLQLGAVYWAYLRVAHMPQGRYLFPMLAPSLLLLWLGIRALVEPRSAEAGTGTSRRTAYAAIATIVMVAALDAAATLLVAVRTYAY